MSKRKEGVHRIPDIIRVLAADRPSVSAGEIAAAAGVTRQAAHYHLARMARDGELQRRGAGRGTTYVRVADLDLRLALPGLEEDVVWNQVHGLLPGLREARDNVRSILRYAFTEMLNNAIDHSSGAEARVVFWLRPESFAFEVRDDGTGAFGHLRERLGLPDDFAALQQLAKGRETTAPDQHSGEGIFFTARVVDLFELDANRLLWTVDQPRDDQAIGDAPEHSGTRVRCEVDARTKRTTAEVFREFVDPETFEFSRTTIPLRLFQRDDRFVSRSEAKRLGSRLERFREVELDFNGITEVGQGFVDELFRVWAREHPETRIVPVHMSPAVGRVVRRALPETS